MNRVAILLTVFNRKDKTLQCLHTLYKQLPIDGYEFDVYLTNDGCTDGTPEAVAEQFPAVNIINAKGDLFWNRGMYTAWAEAAKRDYDFYLWLNDDVTILDGAITTMLKESAQKIDRAIIVGTMRASTSETITYGGHGDNALLVPNGALQLCRTFVGNLVLIPSVIFKKVGNLDWRYSHSMGDLDYGYRTRRAGFDIYLSSIYSGICDANTSIPKWRRADIPFIERLKNLYSPLSYSDPREFLYFEFKNIGLLLAIKHLFTIHLRLLLPTAWERK